MNRLKNMITNYYLLCGLKRKFLIFIFLIIHFSISDGVRVSAQFETNNAEIINSDNNYDYDISKHYLYTERGKSSWYGKKFHNRKTASGEIYNMYEYTAAHKYLPFGTIVRVKNLENNKSFIVRVNDRGPFIRSRIIDLSYSVAVETNSMGTPNVQIETLKENEKQILEKLPNTTYYFCYSFNFPLATLPEGALKKLAAINDFDEAMNLYKEFLQLYPEKKIYLAVRTNYLKSKNLTTFYICHYDTRNFNPLYPLAENLSN